MLNYRSISFAAIALIVTLSGACATTSVEESWTSRSPSSQPLGNVVTMFISETNSTTMRRAGEDRMAKELAHRGIRATPAYALFGDQPVGDIEMLKPKLKQLGYDGLVTMRLIEAHQEVDYAPGDWGGGYWWYGGYYSPGYVYTQTVVRMETRAYATGTGELVWSAITKSYDDDANDVVEDASQIAAKKLGRAKAG